MDFADLDEIFDGRFVVVAVDARRNYGEPRFNMLAEHHGVVLNVTFTPRGPKYRIISARIANREERGIYHAKRQTSGCADRPHGLGGPAIDARGRDRARRGAGRGQSDDGRGPLGPRRGRPSRARRGA
ncbi:BrnT family toxin [Methylobacterium hispanicum]|uniref:BrnT family toxin n=1 Tax=Methylobacterium hispanicum TaxID=270350 RepID=UPI002F35BF49